MLMKAKTRGRDGAVAAGSPIVSCVIPSFENLAMFSRCVLSALTQEGVDLEVVVTDDSRSQDIADFVQMLQSHFGNLRYVQGPRSGRPIENWNAGMDAAQGKFIHLMHQDEFMVDRRFLCRACELLLEGNDVVVARSHVIGLDRPSMFGIVSSISDRISFPVWTLYAMNWIGSTASVVFRNASERRFDTTLTWLVDVDFYVRLLTSAERTARLPHVVIGSIGHHPSQISAGLEREQLHLQELSYVSTQGRLTRRRAAIISAALRVKYAMRRS